jgi:hypothetical protein
MQGVEGSRRLLRTGLWTSLGAITIWLLALYGATTLANNGSDPSAKMLLLTFTVLMWPAAVVGLLLLLCWSILSIAGGHRTAGRISD